MDLLNELQWRGMIQDLTEGAAEAFVDGPVTGYIGFDPTAPSLHIGNLLTIMGLVHLQRAGHHPIAVAGGGTGLIGDPSGKNEERQLLTKEQAAENLDGIKSQLAHYLDFEAEANPARMVNNLDWLGELKVVDFYRDIGKHFSVNAILKKESVRRRLEDGEHGISYTEFSYLLLQAYDFLELHDRYGCTVQMGGSDQWGNITAGIELIRRMRGAKAHGVVFPLLTTSTGAKFGKTEGGAVWLDPDLTSPYRFHQYWLNVDDGDVVRFLNRFTLLDQHEISALAEAVEVRPHERAAQKALADDVTRRLHGDSELERAKQAGSVLFGGEVLGLGAAEIEDIFSDVPSSEMSRDALGGDGTELVELLTESGVATSRGDARRSLEGGGIYLNNVRVTEVDRSLSLDDALEGKFLVLRKGKKSYHLVRVTD